MSFTNLRYDPCAYEHLLRESTGAGAYRIGTPSGECVACFDAVCEGPPLIDINSELRGITRRATQCPAGKMPRMPECSTVKISDCRRIANEHTRVSNPPCTMRGSGINRFQWLCADPQEAALRPFATDVNNSLLIKDAHRPRLVEQLDARAAMPPSFSGPLPVPGYKVVVSQAEHPPFNTVWR